MVSLPRNDIASALADRSACFRTLSDHPRSKRELEDVVTYSRSTLDRAVRELTDADLIQYAHGKWRPTLLGRCAYRTREAYLNRLDSFAEARSILRALPPESPIDEAFLDGVDVHTADPMLPDGIIWSLLERVEMLTHLRIVAPVVTISIAEAVYDCVTASGSYTLDIIVPHAVVERADDPFVAWLTRMVHESNVHLSRAHIPFSFDLWIADIAQAGITVFTDQGGVYGLLINDSERAITWATELYERVHHDANPLGSQATTNSQLPSPPDTRAEEG